MSWFERQLYKFLSGSVTVGGALRGATVTADNLTSGRVPIATTGGQLTDNAALGFSGTTLSATNVTSSGTVTAAALAGAALNWQDWTPNYSGSGDPAMTYTSVTTFKARYATFGKIFIASVRTTAGTTGGTARDAIYVSVPAGISLVDTGAFIGCLIRENGAFKAGYVSRGTASNLAVFKSDVSVWTLATGTYFGFTFIGEIA
jgi:hypothetical protein